MFEHALAQRNDQQRDSLGRDEVTEGFCLAEVGTLFANQPAVEIQQIVERIAHGTHYLNAGQIRCQDAAERLNHLAEVRQQAAFFFGQSRQLFLNGLLLRLVDVVMAGFLAGKHAECIVGQLDQLALGGKASIFTYLKSLIPPDSDDRGSAILALVGVELLAAIAMNVSISRIGARRAAIIVQRIRSVVMLLALLTGGVGLLGHNGLLLDG